MTEQFSTCFITIASKLVDHFPPGKYGWSYVQKFYRFMHTMRSFKIKVSESVVLKILQNVNSSKAIGLDQLSLRHILNLSLVTGKTPDDLKYARVTPIY